MFNERKGTALICKRRVETIRKAQEVDLLTQCVIVWIGNLVRIDESFLCWN